MEARLCVIGLGYVGLPLAVALARHFPVIGFDIDGERVDELRRGRDRTREVEPETLATSTLSLTRDPAAISGHDIYIVTVPTPVDAANRPDLTAVRQACQVVGRSLKRGSIVVLESTVYPGVTEDICGPELESASGLVCGRDFFLGYSPERINPGDREHTVERITKVVAGQTAEVSRTLSKVYGAITKGGTFVARSIKVAEAAKVIENAQRDINIAFVNEVTVIFNKLGLSIHDVLAASRTKWNFLPFTPGLVGGHCIGVDPYYLADAAQKLGHHPEVILAGRRINDGMGRYIADSLARLLAKQDRANGKPILVLGLTFKENVPDLRNSKVIDVVHGLQEWGYRVDVHDGHADPAVAKEHYGIDLLTSLDSATQYRCIVGAVAHEEYKGFTGARLARFVVPNGVIADIKGMWRDVELPAGLQRWEL